MLFLFLFIFTFGVYLQLKQRIRRGRFPYLILMSFLGVYRFCFLYCLLCALFSEPEGRVSRAREQAVGRPSSKMLMGTPYMLLVRLLLCLVTFLCGTELAWP